MRKPRSVALRGERLCICPRTFPLQDVVPRIPGGLLARIVPWSRVRAEKAIEAAEAAAPSPEKPKDTKGE